MPDNPLRDELQWGGRFEAPPDPGLLAFDSSLEDDLVLAAFDVRTNRAHLLALAGAALVEPAVIAELEAALARVGAEVDDGTFLAFARSTAAEDVHGAIDLRIRQLAPVAGEWLHAGRSRNDQVATTLLLYARDRAARGLRYCTSIARHLLASADEELAAQTLVAATTHGQPAQPILFAYWLEACAEGFARAAARFAAVERGARTASPLGSAACCGSGLPLDRAVAARALGFEATTANALDAAGDRDVALDVLHAFTRALLAAGRVAAQIVAWSAPAYAYAVIGGGAATGSSLMPQKRNPDPFELVRSAAAAASGQLAAALATTAGLTPSYHRDLQETKSLVVRGSERGLAVLAAFDLALTHVRWNRAAMTAHATDGYTVATDVADALILRGIAPRTAHHLVGLAIQQAESAGRPLTAADVAVLATSAGLTAGFEPFDAPLGAAASVRAKRTSGSTHPQAVREAIDGLYARLQALDAP